MNEQAQLPPQKRPSRPVSNRQRFIRWVAWFGLAVYVPAFLIVLLWPGLIVSGAKKLITQEVNQRFEKLGGLKSALSEHAGTLKDKFTALKKQQSAEEEDMNELGTFVDENAEKIVSAFVHERTSELKKTSKFALAKSKLIKPETEENLEVEADFSSEAENGGSPSAEIYQTSRTAFSKLKYRFQNRIASVGNSQGEVTTSPLDLLFLTVTAGSNSLLSVAVERGRVEITRMENALSQKFDETVRALVKEMRIFTCSNIIIFGLLWLVSLRRGATRLLFPTSLVLLMCTLMFSYVYVMQTNWILTILHRSYLGWGYLVIVFAVTIYIMAEGSVNGDFLESEIDED